MDYLEYLKALKQLSNKSVVKKTICYLEKGLCVLKNKNYEGEIYSEGEIAVPVELEEAEEMPPYMEGKDRDEN